MPSVTWHPPNFQAPEEPLGETLHLLRLTGSLYCRAELSAPWGISVPELPGSMTFQVVLAGRCWLEVDGEAPRELGAGSLTMIPRGTPHRVRSGRRVATQPLFELPVRRISERYETLQLGGGGEVTQVMYVVGRFDHAAAQRLIELLPRVVQIDTWADDERNWLHSTLRFVTREASALRPGGETVITRLADVLVIQGIRAWLDSAPEARSGWLGALRDPQIGRALAAIHRAPEQHWSVDSLAGAAAMSRSTFSARFRELVGDAPIQYLTWWRLRLGRARLQETSEPLSTISREVGYESEPAFCRAFKRLYGVSPGSLRR